MDDVVLAGQQDTREEFEATFDQQTNEPRDVGDRLLSEGYEEEYIEEEEEYDEEEDAFNVTYELLKPLDELNALRIYDITEKLSNSIIISEDGRIVSRSGHNYAVKYFLKINKLSREDYELLPAEVKEKYELILRVFLKAQVRMVEEDKTIRSLSEEKISFGDPHCIAFDYHKMQTIILHSASQ